MAADLVGWFQTRGFTAASPPPKRNSGAGSFWHAPARIIRTGRQQILRITEHLPKVDGRPDTRTTTPHPSRARTQTSKSIGPTTNNRHASARILVNDRG